MHLPEEQKTKIRVGSMSITYMTLSHSGPLPAVLYEYERVAGSQALSFAAC